VFEKLFEGRRATLGAEMELEGSAWPALGRFPLPDPDEVLECVDVESGLRLPLVGEPGTVMICVGPALKAVKFRAGTEKAGASKAEGGELPAETRDDENARKSRLFCIGEAGTSRKDDLDFNNEDPGPGEPMAAVAIGERGASAAANGAWISNRCELARVSADLGRREVEEEGGAKLSFKFAPALGLSWVAGEGEFGVRVVSGELASLRRRRMEATKFPHTTPSP
jgi:hypothetical protein